MEPGCYDTLFPFETAVLIGSWWLPAIFLAWITLLSVLIWRVPKRLKLIPMVLIAASCGAMFQDHVKSLYNFSKARELSTEAQIQKLLKGGGEAVGRDNSDKVYIGTRTLHGTGESSQVTAVYLFSASKCYDGYLVQMTDVASFPQEPHSHLEAMRLVDAERAMICRPLFLDEAKSEIQIETLKRCVARYDAVSVSNPSNSLITPHRKWPSIWFEWCRPIGIWHSRLAYCEASKINRMKADGIQF